MSEPVEAPRPRRRRFRSRVEEVVRDATRDVDRTTGQRLVASAWRIGAQVVRQWARDRCPQQAASLAFQTVLSLVPLLAVSLAMFRVTGAMDAESSLVDFISSKLIPVSPETIADKLQRWSENISIQSLGIMGLLGTVLLAFVMFNNVEKTMNQIWRVERRRPLTQKFVVFYATATIGPILFGTSLYQAARFGLTTGMLGFLASIAFSFLAIFLANYFLPATRVNLGPAAIGAAFTTIATEIAKLAFTSYVSQFAFDKYAGIYGAVAVVPLLLIWIYWSWLMLLFGVEVAHAAQNIQWLERRDRRATMSLENELLQRVTGPMAARVMAHVAEAYRRGDKVVSRAAIADRFALSPSAVERLAGRLVDGDLLLEVDGELSGFIPARPLTDITLREILSVFRSEDRRSPLSRSSHVERVLLELDATADATTAAITLDDLVQDAPKKS